MLFTADCTFYICKIDQVLVYFILSTFRCVCLRPSCTYFYSIYKIMFIKKTAQSSKYKNTIDTRGNLRILYSKEKLIYKFSINKFDFVHCR